MRGGKSITFERSGLTWKLDSHDRQVLSAHIQLLPPITGTTNQSSVIMPASSVVEFTKCETQHSFGLFLSDTQVKFQGITQETFYDKAVLPLLSDWKLFHTIVRLGVDQDTEVATTRWTVHKNVIRLLACETQKDLLERWKLIHNYDALSAIVELQHRKWLPWYSAWHLKLKNHALGLRHKLNQSLKVKIEENSVYLNTDCIYENMLRFAFECHADLPIYCNLIMHILADQQEASCPKFYVFCVLFDWRQRLLTEGFDDKKDCEVVTQVLDAEVTRTFLADACGAELYDKLFVGSTPFQVLPSLQDSSESSSENPVTKNFQAFLDAHQGQKVSTTTLLFNPLQDILSMKFEKFENPFGQYNYAVSAEVVFDLMSYGMVDVDSIISKIFRNPVSMFGKNFVNVLQFFSLFEMELRFLSFCPNITILASKIGEACWHEFPAAKYLRHVLKLYLDKPMGSIRYQEISGPFDNFFITQKSSSQLLGSIQSVPSTLLVMGLCSKGMLANVYDISTTQHNTLYSFSVSNYWMKPTDLEASVNLLLDRIKDFTTVDDGLVEQEEDCVIKGHYDVLEAKLLSSKEMFPRSCYWLSMCRKLKPEFGLPFLYAATVADICTLDQRLALAMRPIPDEQISKVFDDSEVFTTMTTHVTQFGSLRYGRKMQCLTNDEVTSLHWPILLISLHSSACPQNLLTKLFRSYKKFCPTARSSHRYQRIRV